MKPLGGGSSVRWDKAAAFGRLCVETLPCLLITCFRPQPPSGGCVLKLAFYVFPPPSAYAAAFGRLCVETIFPFVLFVLLVAAAFGRLCVETDLKKWAKASDEPQPPSGGCVLKPFKNQCAFGFQNAAAFGRLCVETLSFALSIGRQIKQPPSGGCVLKQVLPA